MQGVTKAGDEATVRQWSVGTGELRQAPFPAGPAVRVVVGADARESVGVLEVTLPAGGAMPEHDHGDSAVLLVPLAGRLRLVDVGREDAAVELRPGSLATIPVGRRVRLENAGETEARTLAVLTPADFAEQLEAWPTPEPERGDSDVLSSAAATSPTTEDTLSASETLAAALEREHREIDRAVEAFLGNGNGRIESLKEAMQALRRHIFLEEEFLFPPLRDAGFVAPVMVMVREHGELWRTMESIESELGGKAAESGVAGQCKVLLALLERHNSKEEPILYPHADSVLGAPASAELRGFLVSGRMPDGWVCGSA